jgi:hypothetical protein
MDHYKVAKQLFQVLDLTEAPETNWSEEETKDYIGVAAKQILPEDQLPDDLKAALVELGFDLKEQVKKVNKARSTIEGKKEKEKKIEIKTKKNEITEKKESKVSGVALIAKFICEKFDITKEEIEIKLKEQGSIVSPATIGAQMRDTLRAIGFLKELGKIL